MSDESRSVAFSVSQHRPVPQGSMRIRFAAGRAGQCWANATRLLPWRRALATACKASLYGKCWELSEEEEYLLDAEFYFARPKGHSLSTGELRADAPSHPAKTSVGDLDKLLRAVCDALTGVAWRDDAQVVQIRAAKRYSERGVEGAHVVVTRLGDEK